ncbi:hypothetical protein JOC86_002397 [Bacillus pakistanensis]|uniref:Uncharacterized protein n=1 Tax=Rossellomorea pakistanensis TaxID=992288 RepID=A0ABS2NDD8_9BACI|nr:hypothetical protein [Bacillus pakistanensis]MBM7585855.1 hypothetical protein [Bacillus pakistanensis]
MLEVKRIENRRFMEGLTLQESPSLFTIGAGSIDGQDMQEVSFELISDTEVEVSHDLYIVESGVGYEYRLQVTYLDGVNMAIYEGEEKIFHRFLSVKTSPDGSYSGDIVYIDELTKEETGYADNPFH